MNVSMNLEFRQIKKTSAVSDLTFHGVNPTVGSLCLFGNAAIVNGFQNLGVDVMIMQKLGSKIAKCLQYLPYYSKSEYFAVLSSRDPLYPSISLWV